MSCAVRDQWHALLDRDQPGEGLTISGKLYQELSNPIRLIEYYNACIVSIDRDQITTLGCDRYCWC